MVGISTLLLSIAVVAATVVSAVICARSGNRVAVVIGLDAAIIAALGILLNFSTRGELTLDDLLVFVLLAVGLAATGTVLSYWRPNQRRRLRLGLVGGSAGCGVAPRSAGRGQDAGDG